MNKSAGIIAIVIGILLIGAYLVSPAAATVSGQGTSVIHATPDLASVSVLIETKGTTAQLAQEQNSKIRENVLASLKGMGYTNEDIKLGYYSIGQDYDWSDGKQKSNGFVARQELVVKTKDFTAVPKLVDAIVNSGALVSYINFELSEAKQNEYKITALRNAGEDARLKASATAEGVGKRIGRLVSVSNQDFYYPGPMVKYAMSDSSANAIESREAATNLAPQDIDVSATVTVEYRVGWF